MNVDQTMELLNGAKAEELFCALYGAGQVEAQRERYGTLLEGYRKKFGDGDVKLFSRPHRDQRQPHRSQPRQSAGRQHQLRLCRRGGGEPFQQGAHRERHLRPGIYH